MNLTLFRDGKLWQAVAIFLVASVLLSLLWIRLGHVYEELMAGPVAQAAVAISPEIVACHRTASNATLILLANNQRHPVEEKIRATKMFAYAYPVFFSLLLGSLAFRGMRRALKTRQGLARVGIALVTLVIYHLLVGVIFFCRLGAFNTPQGIPPLLKFMGALSDITQMFFPFVLFAIIFIWWAPRDASAPR